MRRETFHGHENLHESHPYLTCRKNLRQRECFGKEKLPPLFLHSNADGVDLLAPHMLSNTLN
jgi:hypothetical protein